jgi:DNA polymerase V
MLISLKKKYKMKPDISEIFKLEFTDSHKIPFLGSYINAGFPSPASDYIDDVLDLNELLISHPAATYFVRVSGDSMINAGIFDHDILIVDRSITSYENKIIVAILDGELTIKRLKIGKTFWFLEPANEKYPTIPINKDSDFIVWGVVTNVIHKV